MKRRTVLVGAAVLAIACLGIWLSRPADPPEPAIGARDVGRLVRRPSRDPAGAGVLSDDADAAVRAIGPAAVPTLLAWVPALRTRRSVGTPRSCWSGA